MLNAIYEAVIQFLFPPRCPSCRAYVEKDGQWCESCLSEILRNKNLAYDAEVRRYISPIVAVGKYDKGLKDLIHELKYQNDFAALPYIYTVLDRLDDEWQQFFADFDYVIPVPLHAEKLKRRGFNQVDRIFSPWAKAHGLHYADILIRTKKTKSQYSLNPSERSINLHAAFALKKDISVANAKCLLLDDIFTTGSTLKNCAKVLKEHGARSVSGLVLASNADD
ncbi:ComF family protein [Megamonas hypermegale]|uniref:ComF family protein n=1 Tax=Megamonas hypermegale TaxID=158847 RepID=UPI0025A3AF95|nr:ComF family protein [Megamonas hypermegale]MDM8142293.1 ComF family protein [Megamonas hypermegale]